MPNDNPYSLFCTFKFDEILKSLKDTRILIGNQTHILNDIKASDMEPKYPIRLFIDSGVELGFTLKEFNDLLYQNLCKYRVYFENKILGNKLFYSDYTTLPPMADLSNIKVLHVIKTYPDGKEEVMKL